MLFLSRNDVLMADPTVHPRHESVRVLICRQLKLSSFEAILGLHRIDTTVDPHHGWIVGNHGSQAQKAENGGEGRAGIGWWWTRGGLN